MSNLVVRSKDEIPDEQYRKMLLTLMERQAGREISGAEVYGQCLIFAPTYELKMELVGFVREEFRHYKLIADLMAETRRRSGGFRPGQSARRIALYR